MTDWFPARFLRAIACFAAFPAIVAGGAHAEEHVDFILDLVSRNFDANGEMRTVENFERGFSIVFNRSDVDISGAVDIGDYVLASQWFNANRRIGFYAAFRKYDIDADGSLSEAEARRFVGYEVRTRLGSGGGVTGFDLETELEKRVARARAELEVETLDGLTFEILNQRVLEKLPADPALIARAHDAVPLAPTIKGFDSNGDDAVTRDEFIDPLLRALEQADRDRDGLVTKEELQQRPDGASGTEN